MALDIAHHSIASTGCSEYEDLTRRLVTALQDAITADLDGASESEVKELNIVHGAHVTTSYR